MSTSAPIPQSQLLPLPLQQLLLPENAKIPPTDIKETIDKSVIYILKNGKSFEERLLKNNRNKHFNFLQPDNEYHQYYQWKLQNTETPLGTETGADNLLNKDTAIKSHIDAKDIVIPKPRDLPFLIDNFPQINQYDHDVIKTTALYISINGQDRILDLFKHETKQGNSAQFEFLKPQHSLHGLFQTYVKQYDIVREMISDPNHPLNKQVANDLDEIEHDKNNGQFNILTRGYDRAQYLKQNRIRKKQQDAKLREQQVKFALIDWQDFAIVEYIHFTKSEKNQELQTDGDQELKNLRLPLNRTDLIKRSLTNKRREIKLEKINQSNGIDHEQDLVESVRKQTSTSPPNKETSPSPTPPPFKGMKIKAAGTTRLKRATTKAASTTTLNNDDKIATNLGAKLIKCPITGKMIPEGEFDTHLRNLLRDPSYKQQQENYIKKNFSFESNITTDQVYENIKRLMKKRTSTLHD